MGIEDSTSKIKALNRHLKLLVGLFLKNIIAKNKKMTTKLIGIINTEIIFLRRNKSILFLIA